jgi:hypothetical protein
MHQRRNLDLDLYVAARALIVEVLRQRCGAWMHRTTPRACPSLVDRRFAAARPSTLTLANGARSSNPNVSVMVSDPSCHFVACACVFGIACGNDPDTALLNAPHRIISLALR